MSKFIAAILLLLFCCLPAHANEKLNRKVNDSIEKHNIILVMTDDQGYGDLSCHGHPFLKHRTSISCTRKHAIH